MDNYLIDTGDMSTDAIDFRKAMPDSYINSIFAQPSQLTRIGTEQGSGARQLIDKVVNGGYLLRPYLNCSSACITRIPMQ